VRRIRFKNGVTSHAYGQPVSSWNLVAVYGVLIRMIGLLARRKLLPNCVVRPDFTGALSTFNCNAFVGGSWRSVDWVIGSRDGDADVR